MNIERLERVARENRKALQAQKNILDQIKKKGLHPNKIKSDKDLLAHALKQCGFVNHKTKGNILKITSPMTQNKALIEFIRSHISV